MPKFIKPSITFILMLLLFLAKSSAQETPGLRPRMLQKVQTIKWEFIMDRMQLPYKKQNQLLPIYNQYQSELNVLIVTGKRQRPIDQMTDAEATEWLQQKQANAQKALEIWDRYQPRFLTVLTPLEVLRFQRAEKEFAARLTAYKQRRKVARRNRMLED